MEKSRNRLIHEKSPYLLQHAHNPVDWYPWGKDAFEKAKKENKPIFLSIGYSTCHWCHVMEKESFEDPEVARLMNEAFVSIKVDREERPDIDAVYMKVCQLLTGTGGWPLTIIMTPDKKPFFASTYISKTTRFGRTGMSELVPQIKELWENSHIELSTSAEKVISSLKEIAKDIQGEEPGLRTLDAAFNQLAQQFDEEHGGFGQAPKFPAPHNLLFMLRYWKRTGNKKALRMVEATLQSMRQGGIFDHIGSGFHRYSTDSKWLLPHFEKMLYDQALLTMVYTEAFQATKNKKYRRTAQEIFTYVLRDMKAKEGAFYSAEDADSEGEEGKFYLWGWDEIQQILQKDEADLATRVFNIEKQGNFSEEATRKKTGANILHLKQPFEKISIELNISSEKLRERLENIREKLFKAREKRIRPLRDDKILTDWNGLMIAALAKSAQAFDEPAYSKAARRASDFVLKNMRTPEGRLFHRYRDGHSSVSAFVDDYAFLIWGLIELFEATFDAQHLRTALELNTILLSHFWDDKEGGFHFTPNDGEILPLRQKEIYDGAIPSGNSVAMLNLLRLGRLTANPELEEKAAQIGRAFSRDIEQSPSAFTQLMAAVDFAAGPSYEVVLSGHSHAKDTKAMIRALRAEFLPNTVILLVPSELDSLEISSLADFAKEKSSIEGKATAYVCHNFACKMPTTDIKQMLESLGLKK